VARIYSRYCGGKTIGSLGFCVSWAVCKHGTDKQWLEITEVDLPLKKAKDKLHGKKIVQISDLHYSQTVSAKYLKACMKRINELHPDIVVMTGDYVTHDLTGKYAEKVVDIVSRLNAPNGIYACLGNHDYGVNNAFSKRRSSQLDRLTDNMNQVGIKLLRNSSEQIDLDGQTINLVGLGDIWAKDFDPDKSFSKINPDAPVIALTHNPQSVEHLKGHNFDTALCGHTHGSRFILTPSINWPFIKKTHHQYHSGLYHVADKTFYVNRGLGRLGRARLNAPPEITVYNLS
jgi:predicted MPP superfamily phosphohydrolase